MNQIKEIAMRMRDIREIYELDQKELASALNISTELYKIYEAGEQDIPVGVLYEFANYFNMQLTTLLTGDEPKLHTYSLVKKGEGLKIERRKAYEYRNLAYKFLDKKAEVFLVTVPPKEEKTIALSEHPGQEFNYIIEGRLKVVIDHHEIILNEGDSLYFDSSKKHGMIALDNKEAKFLAMIM